MPSPWTLPDVLTGPPEEAAELVAAYFTRERRDGSGPYWSGSRFERFAPSDPDVVSAEDLVAVTMLGVTMPPHAALRILEDDANLITALLADVPCDLALSEASPEVLARGSSAWRLWRLIDDYHHVGSTLTSKLLARKRPALIPIQDSVVRRALRHADGDDFWSQFRDALTQDEAALTRRLESIRELAQVGSDISLLRIFDVAVWMRHH